MRLFSKYRPDISTIIVIALGIAFVYYAPINQQLFSFKAKPSPTATPDYSGWRTYANQKFGLTLKYPATFQLVAGKSGPLAEWQLYGLTNGVEIVSVEIPRSILIRTNFGGASLRVGVSIEATAVKECLNPPASFGYKDAYTQRVIGGVVFQEFTRSDTGAGNYYEFTSYRAVRNGLSGQTSGCEVFEYVIHHTNIQNYPAEAGRKEFDRATIITSLESILDTVRFVK